MKQLLYFTQPRFIVVRNCAKKCIAGDLWMRRHGAIEGTGADWHRLEGVYEGHGERGGAKLARLQED